MRPLYFLIALAGFLLPAQGQVNLSAGAETGYETGVYYPRDSTYKNSAYLTPSAEVSYERALSDALQFEASAPVSVTLRREGNDDKSAEGDLALVQTWGVQSVRLSGAAGYNAFPGSLDPDLPASNAIYKLTAEYAERRSYSLKVDYAFSVTDAIDNPRTDLKNKLRLKMGFHPSEQFSPGFSLGIARNLAYGAGYDYYEVDGSLTATYMPDSHDSFLAMLYLSRRGYDVSGSAPTGKAKGKGSGVTAADNAVINSSFNFAYSRELSDHFEAEVKYGYLSFRDPGGTVTSNTLGISLTWRLNPL